MLEWFGDVNDGDEPMLEPQPGFPVDQLAQIVGTRIVLGAGKLIAVHDDPRRDLA